MSASRLTICSVSFRSGHFLDLNWKFTAALNPPPMPAWLVVDNTPPGPRSSGDSPSSPFTILPGVPPPSGLPEKVLGSYHHAAALQTVLAHVTTRYLLILDPDFYIVRPGWVQRVVEHMEAQELAFFGVPWHPRWFVKYRGFPCVHCLFIDTEQVKIGALDFTPDDLAPGRTRAAWKTLARKTPKMLWPTYLAARKIFLALTQAGRWQIGQTADTGTRVFRRFGADEKAHAEIATPVFDESREAHAPPHARTAFARRLERLLPPRFRYFPEPGACTARRFADRGFPDARALGCEEFVWQDEPFGFHYRQTAQAATPEADRKAAVENLTAAFLAAAPLPR